MFYTQSEQYHLIDSGQSGRPDNYPVLDDYPELLFYIQRNQNLNTVIYEINMHAGGLLNLNEPIKVSWINFEKDGSQVVNELNYIQKKLAYGYQFKVISNDLISFKFVSYDSLTFYLAKNNCGRFRVFAHFENINIEIKMIYIYAEDFGVFPQVKFAEFFGSNTLDDQKFYKKLLLQ